MSLQRRSLARRVVRGRPGDPRWARPGLLGLLAGTAVLYLWSLGTSGWANSFYSAAVQAGATSWKAFFFGSSDASNFITVDKTPAALWPPALAARVFGLGSWSVLVPQALMGVATVGVLHATVRRTLTGAVGESGAAGAALLAGTAQALTPVAALMFRFNNPDALLVLLLTLGRWGGRGPGGLLDAAAPSAELTALLKKGGGAYTWVAAAAGSNNAAGLQLATGRPVMAVGGFNGTDPAPAPARFRQYVAAGRIHYFVGDGMTRGPRAGNGNGASDYARRIGEWVRTHFTATTIGNTTVYDLTRPRS